MNAEEFTANLGPEPVLNIPNDAASRLPKTGIARVIILTLERDTNAEGWYEISARNLARAYGEAEPECMVADLKQ